MKLLGFLATLGAGAGLAYLFDPERGRARRARVRDKAVSATNRMGEALEGTSRHWSNIARGYAAEARGLVTRGREAAEDAAAEAQRRL
jgi:hypothetical protein